ncbi:MAG: hypothetical protein NE328_18890 [Lentisphaeraceae bacterium]|nr:hypothetical protein [Lentisphaeraceae bacterium]
MSRFIRLGNAGIRGIVGSGLNLRRTSNYCSALATWTNGQRVLIGCDTRQSTPFLKSIAFSSFIAAGSEIIDCGVLPAPTVQFLVKKLKAAGGCIIGASHHGLGWNAILPLNSSGACAQSGEHQDILNILHSRQFKLEPWDKLGKVSELDSQYLQNYIDEIFKGLNLKAIRKAKHKIVVDCCNGSASVIIKQIFEKAGVELITINDELNGYLPHDPEPRPRTAYQTKALLETISADIGFVLNSDATRVSLVTSAGETLSEELTFPLVTKALLDKTSEPQIIISNVCTTRSVEQVAKKHGSKVIKVEVGQSAAVESLQETGAMIAGDGMGSIAFKGAVPGFDAFRSMLVILEAMALNDKSSATLVNELPRYHIYKSKIPCNTPKGYAVIQRCSEIFENVKTIDKTDGTRFEWKEGWVHLRVSETEPILRLISEWPTMEQAREKAEYVKRTILRTLSHE